ncbi:PAS domain-containing protein [Kiloniella sp. b19]|uniref:PAS domain-containing protein n=1 Tax=Kiloniella sp. GXU_MW_B19 TaxID=3141326 RepID=UPI0031D0D85A
MPDELDSTFHEERGLELACAADNTEFADERLGQLFNWWQGNRGDFLPLRSAFDIVQFKSLVPNIFLFKRKGPSDYEWILQGEEVIALFGKTTKLSDLDERRQGEVDQLFHYYDTVLERKACFVNNGNLNYVNKPSLSFQSIDCPISSDGTHADMIIGIIAAWSPE